MNKKYLFVLGMHRSGTSAMIGVLTKCLKIYNNHKDHHWGDDNVKGGFEHKYLVDVNEKILGTMNTGWSDEKPLDDGWYNSPMMHSFSDIITNILVEDCTHHDLVTMKDPRVCILLPLYIRALKKSDIDPLFLIINRDDIEVANSLQKRNGMEIEKGLKLCEKYKQGIEDWTEGFDTLKLDFNDLIKNPVGCTDKLISTFNLDIDFDETMRDSVIDWIDPDLKHHNIKE